MTAIPLPTTRPVFPLPFVRNLAIANGAIPLAMLVWDAWRGQLGANAVNNALHITGILSLVFQKNNQN